MRTQGQKTTQLGELVVAVFDEAAQFSADPRVISRLATRAVNHLIRRSRGALRLPGRRSLRMRGVS